MKKCSNVTDCRTNDKGLKSKNYSVKLTSLATIVPLQ